MTKPNSPGPALDPRAELSSFLRTRRARLQPEDVGAASYGSRRRVPGLRREELAQLAGVSVAYYTRLEQGHAANVSDEVLSSIARVLRLSASEREHLFLLARPQPARRQGAVAARQQVRPELVQMLEAMDALPVYAWGRCTDILVWNTAAWELYEWCFDRSEEQRNWARIVFTDPQAPEYFLDWEAKAAEVAGQLRVDAGQHASDARLAALVAELSASSARFRELWAAHDVKQHAHGSMRIAHSTAGELQLRYETLMLPGDADQALTVTYAADEASRQALG